MIRTYIRYFTRTVLPALLLLAAVVMFGCQDTPIDSDPTYVVKPPVASEPDTTGRYRAQVVCPDCPVVSRDSLHRIPPMKHATFIYPAKDISGRIVDKQTELDLGSVDVHVDMSGGRPSMLHLECWATLPDDICGDMVTMLGRPMSLREVHIRVDSVRLPLVPATREIGLEASPLSNNRGVRIIWRPGTTGEWKRWYTGTYGGKPYGYGSFTLQHIDPPTHSIYCTVATTFTVYPLDVPPPRDTIKFKMIMALNY